MGLFSDVIPENQETCFVCGRAATTVEHVIPKWLQRRFNLWDQKLMLPNWTDIAYRQLLVPACAKCNSEVYGALEKRVEADTATDAEIWRWANKIHYALGYKDRILEWDRRNPGRKIGDIISNKDPLERDRHFLHCVSGDFAVDPDPFGSVFRFEFSSEQDFAFAHPIAMSQSICVSLGHVGYVVFILDGQALARDIGTRQIYAEMRGRGRKEDMLFFYAQSIEHLARHTLGQNIVMTDRLLARVGRTVVHEERPPDNARFDALCTILGLRWVNDRPATIQEGHQTILRVLEERNLVITESVRLAIIQCADLELLSKIIPLACTVELAEELLGHMAVTDAK